MFLKQIASYVNQEMRLAQIGVTTGVEMVIDLMTLTRLIQEEICSNLCKNFAMMGTLKTVTVVIQDVMLKKDSYVKMKEIKDLQNVFIYEKVSHSHDKVEYQEILKIVLLEPHQQTSLILIHKMVLH